MNDFKLNQLPPLSLYIHMPWCVKKCPYCDFNSHNMQPNGIPEAEYIQLLISDLEQALPLIWGRNVKTIFIGGGTPSLFSPQAIDQLLCAVRSRVNLSPMAEITLEANPGTVDNSHLSGYAQAGVNRISLGIQSFNDTHLKTLGRIHNADEAYKAIEIARKYFTNFNLDIIYGLPKQTMDELAHDLKIATSLKPTHLSCYNLTLEPNTQFATNPPQNMPDNDTCHQMQEFIQEFTTQNSYIRYETSAYSMKDKQCQHNLNYWKFGDYLGIGAGAHSKLSFHDKIIRQIRQKHPTTYMQNVLNSKHIIENKIVTIKELPFEFMLGALRLIDGIDTILFSERTGLNLSTVLSQLLEAGQKGLITLPHGKIIPTILGQDFLNDLLMLFLEDNNE